LKPAALVTDAQSFRQVPIVKDGTLVGILTIVALASISIPGVTKTSFATTHYPVTVTPQATGRGRRSHLLDLKIGGLPVVEEVKLLGIIT